MDTGIILGISLDDKHFNEKLDSNAKKLAGMGDVSEEASKKISDAIKNQSDSIGNLVKKANEELKQQKDIIADIETDIKSMEQRLKGMPASQAQQEITKDLIYAKRALKEEKAYLKEKEEALKQINAEHKRGHSLQDQTAKKAVTLMTKVREVREELIRLEDAGKQNTEEYQKLTQEFGKLSTQMRDVQQRARVLADEHKNLKAFTQGIQGITGAMSVAQGAMGLLGTKNENLGKVMLRVQSLMAITIGLQQVQNLLYKESHFNIVILDRATKSFATTLRISQVAAKGLLITMTGGLIIAISALVSWLEKLNIKKKETAKLAEELAERELQAYQSMVEQASKSYAEILILQEKYAKIDSLEAKEKFLKKHARSYRELGVEVKTVADQENLLIHNTDAYIQSVIAMAKADAYRARIAEETAKLIEIEQRPLLYVKEPVAMIYGREDDEAVQRNIKRKKEAEDRRQFELRHQQKVVQDLIQAMIETDEDAEELRTRYNIKSIQESETKKQKARKEQADRTLAIIKKLTDEVTRGEVDAMQKGYEKTLAYNKYNLDRELAQLRENKQAIKDERDLSIEEQELFNERERQLNEKYITDNQRAFDELIRGVETYQQKREAIENEHVGKIDKLREHGLIENIAVVEEQMAGELKKLDDAYAVKQFEYEQAMKMIADAQLETLKKELSYYLSIIERSQTDEERAVYGKIIEELKKRIDELKKRIDELDSKEDKKVKDSTIKNLNELRKNINLVIASFENTEDSVKSALTAIVKGFGGVITILEGIDKLSGEVGKSLSLVEKSSVILAIAGAGMQLYNAIADIFRSKSQKQEESLQRQLEYQKAINDALREQNMLIADANNLYFGQDVMQALSNYRDLVKETKKEFEDFLLRQEARGGLVSSYFYNWETGELDLEVLRYEIWRLKELGKDSQAEMLETVIEMFEGLEEVQGRFNDLIRSIVGSLRDDLMKALVDAWKAGADASEEYGKIVGKMLDNLLKELVYTKFFAEIFTELEEEIGSIFTKGNLTSEEQAMALADAMQAFGYAFENASAQGEIFYNSMRDYMNQLGFEIDAPGREAQARGIQSISQESADRIDGALTALLGTNIKSEKYLETINNNSALLVTDVRAIRINTDKLDSIAYNINQMVTNGVTLK